MLKTGKVSAWDLFCYYFDFGMLDCLRLRKSTGERIRGSIIWKAFGCRFRGGLCLCYVIFVGNGGKAWR